MHPCADVLNEHKPTLEVVTHEMTKVEGGLRVVTITLVGPYDYVDCRLTGGEGYVEASAEADVDLWEVMGDLAHATAPYIFGLAPCRCCMGERWPLTVSMLPVENASPFVPHVSSYLKAIMAADLLGRPNKYCLRDMDSFYALRGR
jgi:hypothetical protein